MICVGLIVYLFGSDFFGLGKWIVEWIVDILGEDVID